MEHKNVFHADKITTNTKMDVFNHVQMASPNMIPQCPARNARTIVPHATTCSGTIVSNAKTPH